MKVTSLLKTSNVSWKSSLRQSLLNLKKKAYNRLTIKKMEDYIGTQPDSENKLIEFKAVQKVAEARGAKYPLSKKWFLTNYPEFKENEISAEQTKALIEAEALAKAEAAIANIALDDADLLDEEEFDETEMVA